MNNMKATSPDIGILMPNHTCSFRYHMISTNKKCQTNPSNQQQHTDPFYHASPGLKRVIFLGINGSILEIATDTFLTTWDVLTPCKQIDKLPMDRIQEILQSYHIKPYHTISFHMQTINIHKQTVKTSNPFICDKLGTV